MIVLVHGRAVVRLLLFLSLTAVCLVLAVFARVLLGRMFQPIRRTWCLGVCAILGIRYDVEGEPLAVCPTIILANHVSYLDIPIIGGLTRATFIAKSEIANWPLFGLIAKVSGTMFIRRHWREALVQRNKLARRLGKGESFVLFAEGTSSLGLDTLPFKTSLLSVAEPWVMDKPIAIQPLTVAYRERADGIAFDRENAEEYAWVGDAELLPHLWQVLKSPGICITLSFGEPVMSWSVTDRKLLGSSMRAQVSSKLEQIRRRSAGTRSGGYILDKIKEA